MLSSISLNDLAKIQIIILTAKRFNIFLMTIRIDTTSGQAHFQPALLSSFSSTRKLETPPLPLKGSGIHTLYPIGKNLILAIFNIIALRLISFTKCLCLSAFQKTYDIMIYFITVVADIHSFWRFVSSPF